MKILNEQKEKLPIDFLTQFISSGWNEVGNLKASIKAIKETFAGTDKVEKILEELVDAYLIAIGQAELFMQNKNYIDQPEIEEANEEIKENLKENLTEELPDIKTLKMNDEKEEDEIPTEEINDDLQPDLDIKENLKKPEVEECDWFCDFDEPVGEKLTDAELYNNN